MSATTAKAAGKRGRLEGGALTEEVIDSSRDVLVPGRTGQAKGLQQYFSPPEAAELVYGVFRPSRYMNDVFDPTAGSGALMQYWPRDRRFGVEIDKDHITDSDGRKRYTAIHGDIQQVYPLLRVAGIRFPFVVTNPPFGLKWRDPRTKKLVNSTLMTLRYSLGVMTAQGQGVLICGRTRFHKEIAGKPEAAGVYALVDCDDLFDGVQLPCTIAFYCQPEQRVDGTQGRAVKLAAPRAKLASLAPMIRQARDKSCLMVGYDGTRGDPLYNFQAIQKEHHTRLADRQTWAYDVALNGSQVAVHLSGFAKIALAEQQRSLDAIRNLNDKAINYFVLNYRQWRLVQEAAADELIRLDPKLVAVVEKTVRRSERASTPNYPVPVTMRLGFVRDLEQLECIKSDPAKGYVAGEKYRLFTRTDILKDEGTIVVETKDGPEERDYEDSRKVLVITVGNHTFNESQESIGYLTEHFEIPDPGDLATKYPDDFLRVRVIIEQIAKYYGFEYKRFQLDDLSRAVMKGFCLLDWEQGLGKTLGQLTWAMACRLFWRCQDCALFVIPQDLIPQWQDECRQFFGRELTMIATQAQAKQVAQHLREGGTGWYCTWYEALGLTGRRDIRASETPGRIGQPLAWPRGEHRFVYDTQIANRYDPATGGYRREEIVVKPQPIYPVEACPECGAQEKDGWDGEVCHRRTRNSRFTDDGRNGRKWITCNYVHRELKVPTMGSILSMAFRRGVICIDELSEIAGDTSLRSFAARGLRCRHPMGATGTPMRNFISDAFWPLWWTAGNASPAFPYDYNGKSQFEADHCVIRHLEGGGKSRAWRRKVLPEITNVSTFWRMVSQIQVRRRQEDCGEPLPPVIYHPIRTPWGIRQKELYAKWLADFEQFFIETHPHSPIVQAGVTHLFLQSIGMHHKMEYVATMPDSDPDLDWTGLIVSNYTPKNMKLLEIIQQRVALDESVLVGSCLIDTGKWFAERLQERGIEAVHIVEERDGKASTLSPKRRARRIHDFKTGKTKVLCTGVAAVRLGHSLEVANNVVITGFPWSFEKFDQFLKRVKRLTSLKPINVFLGLVEDEDVKSIDVRKHTLVSKKGDSSDMAFDGRLIDEPQEAVDWNEVLRQMQRDGARVVGNEVDELDLEMLWHAPEFARLAERHGLPALQVVKLARQYALRPEQLEPILKAA